MKRIVSIFLIFLVSLSFIFATDDNVIRTPGWLRGFWLEDDGISAISVGRLEVLPDDVKMSYRAFLDETFSEPVSLQDLIKEGELVDVEEGDDWYMVTVRTKYNDLYFFSWSYDQYKGRIIMQRKFGEDREWNTNEPFVRINKLD